MIGGYAAFSSLLLLLCWRRLPEAPALLAVHAAALLLLWIEVKLPNPTSFAFRHWYPLPYVAACYKEMGLLIPDIRGRDYDRELAAIDLLSGAPIPRCGSSASRAPRSRRSCRGSTRCSVPAVLVVAFLLWRRRSYDEFRRYAFLIAAGFLVSYVGYVLVPARGPRFLLAALQHQPLEGLWLYEPLCAARWTGWNRPITIASRAAMWS